MKPTRRVIVATAVLVILMFPSALILPKTFAISQAAINSQVLPSAENFLVNQYNATIGLDAEYPGATTYWLYSDNFLAAYVLQNVNPSNITELKVAGNISHTLDNYMAGMPDPLNQYMILTAGVFAFYASSNYDVTNIDGATIGITLNNGTTALSPNNYADIAFLEALYYNGLGQRGAAVSLFDIGASMYDGIGLKDVAFNGTYQTYKLALYIYAAKVLGENYASSAEVNLLDMKASNGGFYSGYNSNYSAAGTFTNVETTSLAVLALSVPNAPTSQVPFYESVDGVLEASLLLITVVGVLFFGSCLMRRLKR